MMHLIMLATAVMAGATLAPPPMPSPSTQSALAAQTAQARANTDRAIRDAERVRILVTALLNDPRFAQANSIPARAALMDEKAPAIAAARIELQAIAAGLSAIPSVSSPNSPVGLRQSDLTVDDVARYATQTDIMLGKFEEFRTALHSGDTARITQAASVMMANGIVILDAQAITFNAARANFHEGGSDHARNSGLACFYQGTAAFMRGALDMAPRAEMGAEALRAADCMETQAEIGRQALVREAGRPNPNPARARFDARLRPVANRLAQATADGAGPLRAAGENLLSAPPNERIVQRHMPALMAVERAYMDIQAEEDRIFASQ